MTLSDSINQVLTFVASDERYGMNLDKIEEVLFMMSFQDLPNMPSFVAGVINLRGDLVPVIDFSERLSKPRAKPDSPEDSVYPSTARMLLLAVQGQEFVLVVDQVERIHEVAKSDLHPIVSGANGAESFLSTMWLNDGVMIPLVEPEQLFSDSDWSKLPHSTQHGVRPNA